MPLLEYFGYFASLRFPLIFNGKSENWHLLLSYCRYLTNFCRNDGWVGHQRQHFRPILLVAMATEMLNLWKKYIKVNSSEAVREIKLKRCRIVYSISRYKKYAFIAAVQTLWLLWQLKIFYRFIMGEKKKRNWIAMKILRNISWVVLTKAYKYCANSSFWIVAMTSEWLKRCSKLSFYSCLLRWAIVAHVSLVVNQF